MRDMTHTERERDILVELGAVRDRERVAFKCGGGGGGDRFIKSGRRRSEEVGGDSQRERRTEEGRKGRDRREAGKKVDGSGKKSERIARRVRRKT